MKEWTGQAVILRLGLFHEADLWLRMLCRDYGLFTVFAFGGAKSKKRFCGCLDIFNTVQCHIIASRNGSYLNLQEATLLEGTRSLRSDWRIMGLGANCLLFLQTLAISSENSGECFAILESLRKKLENSHYGFSLMASFFRLRIAAALGFAPNFSSCGVCGGRIEDNGIFIPEEGQVFCQHCVSGLPAANKRMAVNISPICLGKLNAISQTLPETWDGAGLNNADVRCCGRAIDGFIQYHLGVAWDNGYFRHV